MGSVPMLNIGPQELILVLIIGLLVVGPQRLPEISRQIGRGLREFRKIQDDVKGLVNLDEVTDQVKGMMRFDGDVPNGLARRPPTTATAPAVHRSSRAEQQPAPSEGSPNGREGVSPDDRPAVD
jgi:TatA/E family protein of Tat protein translocase